MNPICLPTCENKILYNEHNDQVYYILPALCNTSNTSTLLFQDPYAQDAASSLVADPYTPELNPYNLQPSGAGAEAAGK